MTCPFFIIPILCIFNSLCDVAVANDWQNSKKNEDMLHGKQGDNRTATSSKPPSMPNSLQEPSGKNYTNMGPDIGNVTGSMPSPLSRPPRPKTKSNKKDAQHERASPSTNPDPSPLNESTLKESTHEQSEDPSFINSKKDDD